MGKLTKELVNELISIKEKEELVQWTEEHKHEHKTFGEYFQELCQKYNTNPSKLSSQCSKSKSYLYKCISDEKIPSKIAIVCIGFALKATQGEINQMLKYAGHKELYPKNMWDATIIAGLHNHWTTYEIDRFLLERNIPGGLLNEEEKSENKDASE